MSASKLPEGLPVSASSEDLARTGPRPNVLLICTDHLRGDFLGVNGHPVVQSPQIDKIALSGINFQHAFSETPVCCPARRILMTGMDSYGIHMNFNRDLQPFPEGPKLAEVMTRAGYQTFAAGKLHTAPPRNRIGFEDVALNEEGRTAGFEYPDDYIQFLMDEGLAHQAHAHGLGNNQYGYRPSPVPEYATSTGWTADQAVRFLRRRDPGRPFLLYVSFDKPHPPITPPAEYYDLYRDCEFPDPVRGDWIDRKPLQRRTAQHFSHDFQILGERRETIQQSLRGMAAMTTHIDSRIGMLMGTLREQRLLANTWVIFISDHGDALFDHDLLAKGDLLAASARVPFFIAPADTFLPQVQAERISHTDTSTPVGLQDVMPTILDICGIEVPANVTGQSLLPFFTMESPSFREVTCGNIGNIYGSTDGTYKYCWHADEDVEFLFHLADDPKDCRDLADDPDCQPHRDKLRIALVDWMSRNNDRHIQEGRLVPNLVKQDFSHRHRRHGWNNRGWR